MVPGAPHVALGWAQPGWVGSIWLQVTRSPHRGKHGVGRIDIVENRFIGMKSRGESAHHPWGCASAPGDPSLLRSPSTPNRMGDFGQVPSPHQTQFLPCKVGIMGPLPLMSRVLEEPCGEQGESGGPEEAPAGGRGQGQAGRSGCPVPQQVGQVWRQAMQGHKAALMRLPPGQGRNPVMGAVSRQGLRAVPGPGVGQEPILQR